MKSIFYFNTFELPRRAGEMKEYELPFDLTEAIGIDVIAVPVGDRIFVDLKIESVKEGVLVTAAVEATAKGVCTRCLDPIELELDRNFMELYRYESGKAHTKAERKRAREEEEDVDEDEELMMEGDEINLEAPIRDCLILDLPINPLCDEECEGLCQICGQKWVDLPDDHAHEVIDARWAGLSGLDF